MIDIGPGTNTKMTLSRDGHRLFCYKHPERAEEAGDANTIVVIDTSSNSVIRKIGLIHNPHIELPDAKSIETGVLPTTDGTHFIVGVSGFHHANAGAIWQRIVVVPVDAPDSALVLDPRFPSLSFKLSTNEKFLFIASRGKDKAEDGVHREP